jgi:hypothetical protein
MVLINLSDSCLTFVLADGVEVKGADFDNGLLHVNLQRITNPSSVRVIEIDSSPPKKSLPQIEKS